ncbi:MAG: hypothetical protein M1812_003007 [Candelaria pacifica]|nr:MAG: hypothetical protein M1812_003007 [Candelaria pacifica]
MKRPAPNSPSPYSKRTRREGATTHDAASRVHAFTAETPTTNGSELIDDPRLTALETELINYASSIKSAQARHHEERQARDARLHALFLENVKASDANDQELKALQQLYAAANGRLVDNLKKVASSHKASHTAADFSPVNGRHDKYDDTLERQRNVAASNMNQSSASYVGIDDRSTGLSTSESSRAADQRDTLEQYRPISQATHFLNSNFNLAEALARVQTPTEASRNHPQAQVDVRPARAAKALGEATYKANPRSVTPTSNHYTGPISPELGRLTPLYQDAKVEAEEGELHDEAFNTLHGDPSTSNMPDPHDHIPRLCPIALSGRERCPHGTKCRLWKKCIFGHDNIEQRRAAMERQQEHYETAK